MRVAHARNPFVGDRKILVAMGEMTSLKGESARADQASPDGAHHSPDIRSDLLGSSPL
jgi:hypothetical protein